MNELLLAQGAFLVRADAMPPRRNQRPGVTLLVARAQPLSLLMESGAQEGPAFVLAPQVQRRFVQAQPHFSLTVEPGHPAYLGFLYWARAQGLQPLTLGAEAELLTQALQCNQQSEFDAVLSALLQARGVPLRAPEPRLAQLLAWVDAADEAASAESLWQRFRTAHGGSQAHCSRWLQHSLGLSLRQWLLWRKLRRAMDALPRDRQGTRVAHGAGFADSAHLARICQRAFGLKPSEAADIKTLQVRRLVDS